MGSGTRFSWDFLGHLSALYCCCCCFAFSPTSLTESCSFWHGMKDIFSLHKSDDKDVLDPFFMITSQAVRGTWNKMSHSSVASQTLPMTK